MRVALAILVLCGVAAAEPPRGTFIRVAPALHAPEVSSRLIYLKRCPLIGCPVKMGNDDSRTQTSSIADGDRLIGAFSEGDQVWNDFVACVKTTYAPFDITVTDVDPGNVPHFEEIVGGHPSDLRGDIANAGGVAPFDCQEIPNAISFTFDVYGPDAESLCWTAAQETAHGFGLEHEWLQKDPMTYQNGLLPKMFQDVDAPCGEFMTRPCACPNRPTQNSYRMIVGLLGPGAPSPPTVAITSPADGKKVQPHFLIRATATDDVRVDHVELWIDGAMADTTTMEPYQFTAPDLAPGTHAIEARAYDVQGTPGSAMVQVDVGAPCTQDSGCDHPDVCVDGQCIPGPDQPGGLGAVCMNNDQCLSMLCADGGDPLKHCVAACETGNAASCPHDFSCISAGATGVCYPAPPGGCCDASGSPVSPALLGLGVVFVLRRKR